MKKIIIAPDSFKGTLSAAQVCEIIARAYHSQFPDGEAVQIPIADGGEGTVDSFLYAMNNAQNNGKKLHVTVKDLFMEDMDAYYGMICSEYLPGQKRNFFSSPDANTEHRKKTAVIEMAVCAGLPLAEGRKNPMLTTTYGVGQLMLHTAMNGVDSIVVGLGGSATNDGGCGAAAACGALFFGKDGQAFIPTGGTLKDINRIDISRFDEALKKIKITAMCDIRNPMYGENGAAYVFAPQKGAPPENVVLLDEGLRHLAELIKRDIGIDVSAIPGAGAAGAMGAGMIAFFGAELRMGIDTVLDTVEFDRLLHGADCVITGEGCFDSQSLGGKAVIGIAVRAEKQNIPFIVVAGGASDMPEAFLSGVSAVFSINRFPESFETAKYKSAENLYQTAENIFRLIKNIKR